VDVAQEAEYQSSNLPVIIGPTYAIHSFVSKYFTLTFIKVPSQKP